MLKAVTRRLFPFHLAPIDEFFLLDDRSDYPMTYSSHIFFTGSIQKQPFLAALEEALRLHPLLCAHIRPAKQGKLCWVQPPTAQPHICWGPLDQPIAFRDGEAIDLGNEVGLRLWVRSDDENDPAATSQLVLQFHHACCDGTGAHRFIGDLLAAYGKRTATGPLPEPATYDEQLLKRRRGKLADEAEFGTFSTAFRSAVGEGVNVFGKRIQPLATLRHTATQDDADTTFPGVVSLSFDRHQHQQLRDTARRMGGMLNDLLMAEMFQTIRSWNLNQGGRERHHMRIMMPSDMRGKQDFAMPAANMTLYNFVTRRNADCADNLALLKGIREETARIQHEQRGRRFVDGIMLAKYVPGLLPLLLGGKRCLSTVTLSNMGDPTRRFLAKFPRQNGKLVAGNLTLEHLAGVSPLRPRTRASISVVNLYRKLHINVRCDPNTMTIDDARSFLDLYGARLSWHLSADTAEQAPTSQLVAAV